MFSAYESLKQLSSLSSLALLSIRELVNATLSNLCPWRALFIICCFLSFAISSCVLVRGNLIHPLQVPAFSLTITLPDKSELSAAEVEVKTMSLAGAPKIFGQAPSIAFDFKPVFGFSISPKDFVFAEPVNIRITVGEEYLPDTTLFLIYLSASSYCEIVDSSRVTEDGLVLFRTRSFGDYLVAENVKIRTEAIFTAMGFAHRLSGPAPLDVNFDAVAYGGEKPYTFFWDFGNGLTANSRNASCTYHIPGEYRVKLIVRDAKHRRVLGYAPIITVKREPDELKSVMVKTVPSEGGEPLGVKFFASIEGGSPFVGYGTTENKATARRSPFLYLWDFGDGSSSSEAEPTHIYKSFGVYYANLTVADASGDKIEKSFLVDLREAFVSVEPSFGFFPLKVLFRVRVLGAETGTQAIMHFGDGSWASLSNLEDEEIFHTYVSEGTHIAQLKLRSGNDGTETTLAELYIVVFPPPTIRLLDITPSGGRIGEVVQLRGLDFGANVSRDDKVIFGGEAEAEVLKWSDTLITVRVPETAVTGPVVVQRKSYRSNALPFRVLSE